MKTTLAILTVLGFTATALVSGLPTSNEVPTRSLSEDLDDFLKLIPTEQITDLFYEYLNNDEDFGEAVEYIMSKEFVNFVMEIESMPEVRAILNYLQEAGLDAYGFVNMLNHYLEIPEIKPSFKVRNAPLKITGGLDGFFKDVKALLPIKQLKSLYEEKLKTSKDFAELVKKMSSPEFQSLVDKIMAKPKLQEIIKRLKSKHVDVQEVLDLLHTMFGLKFGKPSYYTKISKSLKDDLEDFVKLIPVDEITDLFYEYLNNDDEFGEVIEYVTSEEFAKFVIDVENMAEFRELLNYLQSTGLDAYGFVNMVNRYLGIKEISPHASMRSSPIKITGGLNGFLQDVKALIPMDKLKKLYEEKLKTSKDFAALINKLSSPEFQSLVNKIFAKPKMQEIINKLKSKNVDVQEFLDLLTSMIGIKFPKPLPPKA